MLIYRGSFSVFSTSVEVIPGTSGLTAGLEGILHECGGDPVLIVKNICIIEYSPRVWR